MLVEYEIFVQTPIPGFQSAAIELPSCSIYKLLYLYSIEFKYYYPLKMPKSLGLEGEGLFLERVAHLYKLAGAPALLLLNGGTVIATKNKLDIEHYLEGAHV